jgi:hypothetical protein
MMMIVPRTVRTPPITLPIMIRFILIPGPGSPTSPMCGTATEGKEGFIKSEVNAARDIETSEMKI